MRKLNVILILIVTAGIGLALYAITALEHPAPDVAFVTIKGERITTADLRAHDVDMLTIGQYLQPTAHHLPVLRYVEPGVFEMFAAEAEKMGFSHAASGPLVRSSYHADQQAHEAGVA